MDSISTEGKTYEEQFFPMGGFVLIAKDMAPQKQGKIIVPDSVRGDHSKFTSTGIIIKKSLFRVLEEAQDHYILGHLEVGDRVGFSATVPLYSPTPPHYVLEGDDKERYITMHIRDILCVICDSQDKQKEFASRFKGEDRG